MKSFVVIGIGRFGRALAMELFRLGHEVLAIDKNEERVSSVADYVTHAVRADACDEQVLRSVGVRNFDCAIVAFADETQDSILTTLLLKEAGVKYVVAKGHNELHTRVLQKIGADRVVFPESDMGVRLAQVVSSTNLVDYIDISDDYSIIEMNVPPRWDGHSIRELDVRARHGINILVVKSGDGRTLSVVPSPDYVIRRGDVLVVIGSNEDIRKLK